MIQTNKLKSKSIKSLPEGWHSDGAGLYLRVANGECYWLVRASHKGQRKTVSLGKFPDLSLNEARGLIEEAKRKIASRAYKARSATTILKFQDMALEALENTARVRMWTNDKHRKQWYSTVKNYAIPCIGKMPVSSITTEDIYNILEPIWTRKTDTATKLQGRLHVIFSYAIHLGYYTGSNPAAWKGCLDQLLPPPSKVVKRQHHKSAKLEDIPEIVQELWEQPTNGDTALAALFGVLTATRAQEFCLARWEEFDFQTMVWSVPPERRKDKKPEPFRVPITREMKAVLDRVPHNHPWVFSTGAGNPLRADCPTLAFKEKGWAFTMHGMRSTFRDWGTETGEHSEYMEKALCHTTGDKVQQAYQRSDCLDQRRPIMERWNALCFSKVATNIQGTHGSCCSR